MKNDVLADHRLYCAFSVRYQHVGLTHVLMPGQALPVWDASKLCRIGPELDIVLITLSMDGAEEFVPMPGMPGLGRGRYRAARQNIEVGNAESTERTLVQQAGLYALGGASGISVLRPNRLPLGLGLYESAVAASDSRLQHEQQPITLQQAEPIVSRLQDRQSEIFLPMPRLYATMASGEGTHEAIDVTDTGEPVFLTETMLPVCACPVADIDMLELCDKATAHLRRLGAVKVWLGLDLVAAGDSAANCTEREPVTTAQVLEGKARSPVLYTLPHGQPADYYAPLRFESKAKLSALFRGQDRLAQEFIPIGRSAQIVVEAPSLLQFDQQCLAQAGMPTV